MKTLYIFLFSIFLLTTTVGQDITATLQGTGSSYGFSVNNNTPTTLFRVRGDGNVGIGTTSPYRPLSVFGTPSNEGGSIDGVYHAYGTIGNVMLGNGANTGYPIISPISSEYPLIFATFVSGTPYERLRITNDGNVGIGTTTPNLKLVVNGQGAFLDRLWIETTNDRPIQILEKSGTLSRNLLSIMNMYGLGVTVGANPYMTFQTASQNLVTLGALTESGAIPPPSSFILKVNSGGGLTERMRVTSSGNVGIGTTNPSEKLEVNGGILVGNTSNTNTGTIRWTGSSFQGYDGSVWNDFATTSGDGDWTISGSDMYSTVSGNVGIGTTTPGDKLEVKDGNLYINQGNSLLKGVNGGARIEYFHEFNLTGAETYCEVQIQNASTGDRALVVEVYRVYANGGGIGADFGKQVWVMSCEGVSSTPTTIVEYPGEYDETGGTNLISLTGESGPTLKVRLDKKYSSDVGEVRIVMYGCFNPANISFAASDH